ncbi:MAG: cytochrome c-type biogenesis protein CcmH [Magnetococcales bacterium]|nr:cytochrome c-type biogenesis protein CcmH [Magnetococcales bacterium]
MNTLHWSAALLLFWLPMAAFGADQTEDADEARVREIALGLRCAVCQNQPVYESNSELARDMVKVIREQVKQGRESDAIRRYFFDRYGDYIYLEPVRSGRNWILWGAPFLGLLAGVGGLLLALGRWRRGAPPGDSLPAAAPGEEETLRARIRRELDRVEL